MNKKFGLLLGLMAVWGEASAQDKPPRWITEGPYVEARSFSIDLPMERMGTKVYVEVELGGKPRRFVFDTGSPSMIDASLASELGLAVVDKRKGRDSHGAVIESDIVQADVMVGGVTFRKVPLFAADFSVSPAAKCFLGDGVLGSEVLPLGAWQIDLPNGVLRCRTALNALPHIKGATKERLYDFGYPHTPILDVRFAKEATSKAMFDTGSPAYVAISPPDFAGARRAGGVGRTISGYGSPGGTLSGQAANGEQVQAELRSFSIGRVGLGRVGAIRRESSPSLIGASVLEHFVVTLDSRSGSAYFAQYGSGPYARPSFGFSLAFDQPIRVSLVWEGSPAAEVGLRAGQRVTSINGVTTSATCDEIRQALDALSGEAIALEWDGGSATLRRKSHILE